MIDKADFRVPQTAPFRPQFRCIPPGFQFGDRIIPARPSRHYIAVGDLRPLGIDAILSVNYRYGHRHDHKLEILETGKKSLSTMAEIITTIFDVDPTDLGLIRADVAADLRDVTVDQLDRTVRVRFKRSCAERGETEYEIIGARRMEYLRYGKRPNLIRIYDKPAECMARFPEMQKRVSRDAEPLKFEEVFGFPPDAVISRVERQIGGGKLPPELATFGKLAHAADFDPFTAIEIVPDEFPMPDSRRIGAAALLKLCGTRYLIERHGHHRTRALLNVGGNASRYMGSYNDYLCNSKSARVTRELIYETYRESVLKQVS